MQYEVTRTARGKTTDPAGAQAESERQVTGTPSCQGCRICVDKNNKPCVRRYRCVACKRSVPWCFGAADDQPDRCDDCWSETIKAAEGLNAVWPGER